MTTKRQNGSVTKLPDDHKVECFVCKLNFYAQDVCEKMGGNKNKSNRENEAC